MKSHVSVGSLTLVVAFLFVSSIVFSANAMANPWRDGSQRLLSDYEGT